MAVKVLLIPTQTQEVDFEEPETAIELTKERQNIILEAVKRSLYSCWTCTKIQTDFEPRIVKKRYTTYTYIQ